MSEITLLTTDPLFLNINVRMKLLTGSSDMVAVLR
jgi:hypothetical protein